MTTTNETKGAAAKATKISGGNRYPFRSKADILTQLATDDEFVIECLDIMQMRQTDYERETKTTLNRNRRGWMSSHAVNMGNLADKIGKGETLDGEEFAKARDCISHYGKQLASHFRDEKLAASPELAETAKMFGVG
jgi:hypothetical protein